MRFGKHLNNLTPSQRELCADDVELLLEGKYYHLPSGDEQKFAFCVRVMGRIEREYVHNNPDVAMWAKRLMRLLVDEFTWTGGHFENNLGDEPYWNIAAMRMWRPMGLLHLMVREWATPEFSEWVQKSRQFIF